MPRAKGQKVNREKSQNRKRLEHKCYQLVFKNGFYLGYRTQVDDEMRISLFVYYVDPGSPNKVGYVKVNDIPTVRLAMEVGNRPAPKDPDKETETENAAVPATPAKSKK